MFDNQENATYSRSSDYSDFFEASWEAAQIPMEGESLASHAGEQQR
jgi:hypothetical protein